MCTGSHTNMGWGGMDLPSSHQESTLVFAAKPFAFAHCGVEPSKRTGEACITTRSKARASTQGEASPHGISYPMERSFVHFALTPSPLILQKRRAFEPLVRINALDDHSIDFIVHRCAEL